MPGGEVPLPMVTELGGVGTLPALQSGFIYWETSHQPH